MLGSSMEPSINQPVQCLMVSQDLVSHFVLHHLVNNAATEALESGQNLKKTFIISNVSADGRGFADLKMTEFVRGHELEGLINYMHMRYL